MLHRDRQGKIVIPTASRKVWPYSDLLWGVSDLTGLPIEEVTAVVDTTFELIERLVYRRRAVKLYNFGVFRPKPRARARHFHPEWRTYVLVPAKLGIRFQSSATLAERLNPGGAPAEPV